MEVFNYSYTVEPEKPRLEWPDESEGDDSEDMGSSPDSTDDGD